MFKVFLSRVCGNSHGLIRKYRLNCCRQCFRSNVKEIGFIKVCTSEGVQILETPKRFSCVAETSVTGMCLNRCSRRFLTLAKFDDQAGMCFNRTPKRFLILPKFDDQSGRLLTL